LGKLSLILCSEEYLNVSDLQNVNITLRILFRPIPDQLPRIYTILGIDYDDRVLPSITTEVLKAVVVSSLCSELTTYFCVEAALLDYDTMRMHLHKITAWARTAVLICSLP
jgi:hypothetical protein